MEEVITQASDKQITISENQKKLNEVRKLIAAVDFSFNIVPPRPAQYISLTINVLPIEKTKNIMIHIYRDSSKWVGDDGMCLCGEVYSSPKHIRNDGIVCDFISNNCACGTMHDLNYEEQAEKDFLKRLATPGYQPTENEEYLIKSDLDHGMA